MASEEEGYIIETVTLGNSMKATAIDPVTLTEATVIVPPRTSRAEAEMLAIRKLHYLLDKKKGEE